MGTAQKESTTARRSDSEMDQGKRFLQQLKG
jgi:hypothetical protein